VPEENFWTLWCKERLTEVDTPTIWLGATPSGLTSAHLHHLADISGQKVTTTSLLTTECCKWNVTISDYRLNKRLNTIYTHTVFAYLKLFPSLEKHQSFFLVVAVLECTVCLLVDTASLLQTVLIIHRQLKLCIAQPNLQQLTSPYKQQQTRQSGIALCLQCASKPSIPTNATRHAASHVTGTSLGCYVTAPLLSAEWQCFLCTGHKLTYLLTYLLTNRHDAYTWCRPQNMKGITYCTVVRVGPSHVKSGRGFWSTITNNHSPYATEPLLGVLWPNDWMNQDATWYEGRPRPRPHSVRWGSSSPTHGNRHISPPHFLAHVYCGLTFAHLSNCWVLVEICEQTDKNRHTDTLITILHHLKRVSSEVAAKEFASFQVQVNSLHTLIFTTNATVMSREFEFNTSTFTCFVLCSRRW